MNSGIQDAHNLAWKLAAVVQGRAGRSLLETYGAERRPVAEANTRLSLANWREALRIPQAMGLDPMAADVAVSLASSLPSFLLPSGSAKGFLEGILAVGRRAAGLSGPLGAARKAALARIFASGETLRLQFPREDLGFSYGSPGALLSRAAASDELPAPTGNPKRGDPYVPRTLPGHRLPHSLLQVVSSAEWLLPTKSGDIISTLDLIPKTGPCMALLAGSLETARLCLLELERVREGGAQGIPCHVCCILPQSSSVDAASAELSQRPNASLLLDVEGRWLHLSEVGPEGAVLVRPDGHVLWRAKQVKCGDLEGALGRVGLLLDIPIRISESRFSGGRT
eukprot:jgi/Botrbrau1/10431/Bobra.0133s0038.1